MNKKDKWHVYGLMRLGLILGYVVCVMGVGEAVTPKIWKDNSQTAFEKGEVEGLSLTREGTVTLGPQWHLMADTQEDFVWSLTSDAQGTIYMGTGVEGRVFALKPGEKDVSQIFDAKEETKIVALTMGPDGALYAGTSPNGLVYRIVKGKPAEVFCQTGDMHVWSLLWQGGTLYAATGGEQGRVLKVAKNKVDEVYQSSDPNMVSLAAGQAGTVYAGTDRNGLIYKILANGQVSVLYDAGEKEVHALVVGKQGMVYAAAMIGQSDEKKNGNGGQSVLYAIRPSGSALRLWETDDPLLLSVTADVDGSLRVVTGKKGRVYRIWPDGTYTLLAHLKDVHPWAVLPTDDGALWIGSSGDGSLYKLGANYVSKGTLTSRVKDFTLVSNWGQAHWQGETPSGTSVSLVLRSGNSETPDDTWSAWSAPITKTGDIVTSRPARFLQYRMTLKSSSDRTTPRLREVQLAGLQENIAPMVMSVNVVKEGEDGDAKREQRGKLKVVWDAGDVNDDQLLYALFFKEVGTSQWLLLKENFKSGHYVWDTETVPDGTVQVKVVASDRSSNPALLARSGEAISKPFQIDNTPPVVKIKSVRQERAGQVVVVGTVEDKTSAVLSAKYAINSGDWQVVFSEDTIFDSPKEKLKFDITHLAVGVYTLVVRAEDVLGNVGVHKTTFEVK